MNAPDTTATQSADPPENRTRKFLQCARSYSTVVFRAMVRAGRYRTVVAVVTAVVVLGFQDPLATWIQNPRIQDTFGKIIVESPEVYTRERLVNDRLRQAVWLRKQMHATEDVLTEGVFRSHEGQWAQHLATAMSLQATANDRVYGGNDESGPDGAAGNTNDATESETETRDSPDAPAVSKPVVDPIETGTSLELFRAMNEYREQVRTELMQTQLDDRHDIDGNTLYRLNFNTTIIHGRRSDALAVIRVELEHGDNLEDAGESFYEALLRDWSQELERRLNEAAESQMRLLFDESTKDHDDSEIYLWLKWKICKSLTRVAKLSSNTETIDSRVDPEYSMSEGQRPKPFRELPDSIDLVHQFHPDKCGDRYYHSVGTKTESTSNINRLDRIIEAYVDRFQIGKPAQDWFSNYAAVRPELLEEIRLRLEDDGSGTTVSQVNPVHLLRKLENRWCQPSSAPKTARKEARLEQEQTGTSASTPIRGDATNAASPEPSPAQPKAVAQQVREQKIVHQHCDRVQQGQNQTSQRLPMFAVMDLYRRLAYLEKKLLGHRETSNHFDTATRFDEIGCKLSLRESVERELKDRGSFQDGRITPELRKAIESVLKAEETAVADRLDFANGLACTIEDHPWLWRRNLGIEQQIDQFYREFLDPDVAISGGTGILAGIIKVEDVGCEAALCQVSVKPMIRSARQVQAENGKSSSVHDPVRCFFRRLDGDYEAFSYGVTPKNWRQRLAFSSAIARNLAVSLEAPALAGTEVKGLFERVMREEEVLRSVINQPIVIGFGRGRMNGGEGNPERRREAACGSLDVEDNGDERVLSRGTEFGWIIAPEKQWDDRGRNWHPHRQYDLAAVISIPSWWRRVKLKVSNCWRKLGDLEDPGTEYIDGCEGEGGNGVEGGSEHGDDHTYFIKIPGDVGEVSRKLRIEVREVPYILTEMYNPSVSRYVFQVGKKTDIVIEGGRLWRSTRVTLGTQSADEISVLPHMEGIVARFNCVRAPPYSPLDENLGREYFKGDGVVYGAKVQVWTSEGVTVPHLPVYVVDPIPNDDKPCPPDVDAGLKPSG